MQGVVSPLYLDERGLVGALFAPRREGAVRVLLPG